MYPQSALPGLAPPRSAGGPGNQGKSILSAYPYLEAADIDEACALCRRTSFPEDETIELRVPVKFLVNMPLSPDLASSGCVRKGP